MSGRLVVLQLADNPVDAELALHHLREGGFACESIRVSTRAEYEHELRRRRPDLVLAACALPAFDAATVLEIARKHWPEVPFLFLCGSQDDEPTIEAVDRGTVDAVPKHRLDRLVPAVRRALREWEERMTRQRLEEKLRQRTRQLTEADQRKDEFLAVLAHELRNPLAPIFNALQIARLSDDSGTREKNLAVADRQLRHMAHLLDDLLDVSRLTRGKFMLRRERLDLQTLVRETLEDHRSALESAGLTLTGELPPGAIWVVGDRTRLAQVLGNLLHNAAKFTLPGGQVTVTLTASGERARLVVRDTGVGVEPELLARLFEPFSQKPRSQEYSHTGLGLGLALVKGLTEMHGGTVTAASEGTGRGAEFALELPLASAGGPNRESVTLTETRPHSRRVLIIDDNRDAADTLGELLELSGHEVAVAYSGSTGLAAARRLRPEVLLCDLGLPDLDGCEVAAALRASEDTRGMRLIAITGYGREEDRHRSREAGFDLHLTKPLDPDQLDRLLEGPAAGKAPAHSTRAIRKSGLPPAEQEPLQ